MTLPTRTRTRPPTHKKWYVDAAKEDERLGYPISLINAMISGDYESFHHLLNHSTTKLIQGSIIPPGSTYVPPYTDPSDAEIHDRCRRELVSSAGLRPLEILCILTRDRGDQETPPVYFKMLKALLKSCDHRTVPKMTYAVCSFVPAGMRFLSTVFYYDMASLKLGLIASNPEVAEVSKNEDEDASNILYFFNRGLLYDDIIASSRPIFPLIDFFCAKVRQSPQMFIKNAKNSGLPTLERYITYRQLQLEPPKPENTA